MEQYVAMFIGNDGCLGPTILCDSWTLALKQCLLLAEENSYVLTAEQQQTLDTNGTLHLDDGAYLHIGGLEEPREE